jgi:hypothetical protein
MQRFAKQSGIAAADYSQAKWLHLPETIRLLGCQRSIMIVETLIAFSPRFHLLTPKLFAKVFTNERVRI